MLHLAHFQFGPTLYAQYTRTILTIPLGGSHSMAPPPIQQFEGLEYFKNSSRLPNEMVPDIYI